MQMFLYKFNSKRVNKMSLNRSNRSQSLGSSVESLSASSASQSSSSVFPVFKFSNFNVEDDPRKLFKTTMSLDYQISLLESKKTDIEKQIKSLMKLKQTRNVRRETRVSRPDDWKYKNNVVRTVHFDERVLANGNVPDVPRVVTIVWTHNRSNGVTRYGAVVWSSNRNMNSSSEHEFDKHLQRQYAYQRYSSSPILVKLDPVPKTNYDVQTCLRKAVHDIGVSSKSKTYQKWMKKYMERSKKNGTK
jgi:hypothetical protein